MTVESTLRKRKASTEAGVRPCLNCGSVWPDTEATEKAKREMWAREETTLREKKVNEDGINEDYEAAKADIG